MVAYFNLDRTITPALSLVNLATKSVSNNMKAKTDPEHRKTKIKIVGAVTASLNCRATTKDDTPAPIRNFFRGGSIRDQRCIYIQIP
jgi:hypothetical protein